jgi:hypothetical protein
VYKVGDYFTYKVKRTIENQGETCTIEFNVKIVVTRIEYPYVYYNITHTNIKTSGNCPPKEIPSEGYKITLFDRIDVKPEDLFPCLYFFVDPSYSGDYSNSTKMWGVKTVTAKYKNGVLISGTVEYESSMEKYSISIELVETSVPGLLIPLWIRVLIVAVIIVVGVTVFILIIKKSKSPPHTTPVAPYSQTSTTMPPTA